MIGVVGELGFSGGTGGVKEFSADAWPAAGSAGRFPVTTLSCPHPDTGTASDKTHTDTIAEIRHFDKYRFVGCPMECRGVTGERNASFFKEETPGGPEFNATLANVIVYSSSSVP